jgi:putative oxidoreductase
MTLVRRFARPMLSSMFIAGGINALKNAEGHVQAAEPEIDTLKPVVDKATDSMPFDINLDKKQMVQLNGVVQLAGGFMLATGRLPRLSAFALAASLVPTTWAGHRFWEETDPQQRTNQQIHFFKNVSMLGGLLLASVDTEGKPGLAWRAKHSAHHAREHLSDINPLTS